MGLATRSAKPVSAHCTRCSGVIVAVTAIAAMAWPEGPDRVGRFFGPKETIVHMMYPGGVHLELSDYGPVDGVERELAVGGRALHI